MANISYGVNILPKTNNAYTLGNSDYKWANIFTNKINGTDIEEIISGSGSGSGESSSSTVEDIQINGTSILDNGVANIPYASGVTAGVIKIGAGLTIGSDGTARINKALDNLIKAGNNEYQPITPSKQHVSVFYGLAKAAGDSTQSASNNTIGTYTDEAKTAIQSMLGIPALLNDKAETIISSASGIAASFSDGADNAPMKSCAVQLLPNQTGENDPSPSNIRLFVTWDGVTITRYGGNLLENKTATRAATSIYIGQDAAGVFPVHFVKGVTYSISFEQDATGVPQVYFNAQDSASTAHLFCEGTQGTYTAEKTENVRLYVYNSKGITSVSNFCLTIGNTPVNEPYTQATEYSVTFPNRLDDIYGGIVDVIKGEVKVTHKKIVISKSEFTGGGAAGLGYKQTEAKYPTCKSLVNWDLARETQKCNKGLISNPYSESDYGDYVGIIYALDSQSQSQARISEALYQALGENDTVEFVYELNEPITYMFTPIEIRTLLGYNSFCADSNNIEVEYIADTKGYVDTKLTSMTNTIVTNLPIATNETLGVVKSGGMGVNINSSGQLYISAATSSLIKAGTQAWTPITPNRQHEAVFYGLAKAAGDSTQSASTNAVGTYTDNAKTAIKNMLGITAMTGATSSAAGTAGLIPAPASADREKFFRGDGTWQDGGRPMVILSYGNSTWNDFITAYNNKVIVYCRASSNSNPKTGSQTRMAFMAYVNNADTPTNVEFQYYRSVNPTQKSATQMSDQVFVYTLTNANGGTWSVTTRQASIQSIAAASGSKIGVSYSNSAVTLSNTMTADDMPMSSSDATTAKAAIDTMNTRIGSLSDQINDIVNPLESRFSTESDFETALLALNNSMIDGHHKNVYPILAAQGPHMIGSTKYMGILMRNTTGYGVCLLLHANYDPMLIQISGGNFTWKTITTT